MSERLPQRCPDCNSSGMEITSITGLCGMQYECGKRRWVGNADPVEPSGPVIVCLRNQLAQAQERIAKLESALQAIAFDTGEDPDDPKILNEWTQAEAFDRCQLIAKVVLAGGTVDEALKGG